MTHGFSFFLRNVKWFYRVCLRFSASKLTIVWDMRCRGARRGPGIETYTGWSDGISPKQPYPKGCQVLDYHTLELKTSRIWGDSKIRPIQKSNRVSQLRSDTEHGEWCNNSIKTSWKIKQINKKMWGAASQRRRVLRLESLSIIEWQQKRTDFL